MIVLSERLPGGCSPLADDLYPILAPLADGPVADEAAGWPLGHYVAALLAPIADADVVAADPRALLNVDRAPASMLSAVEQSVGALVDLRLTAALRRERVRRRAAEKHGRPTEIRAAVAETLTAPAGQTPLVRLRERRDPTRPDLDFFGTEARFHLIVLTRTAQTPDPPRTAARAQEAAPMRTVVHHLVTASATYDEVTGTYNAATGTYNAN